MLKRYCFMKGILPVSVFALVLMSFTYSEVVRYIYQRDGLHVEYGKEHGMLTSRYTSYWPNGKKKAEGEMKGNMRFGDWQVFDSSGYLVTARTYETGYAWKQLYPIEFDQTNSRGWFGDRFSLFVEIKPDSVLLSTRIWRMLHAVEQSPIFHSNALLDTLIALHDRGVVSCGEDDQMLVLSSVSGMHERIDRCNPQHHVIGYKLKEDWYYDAKKHMGIHTIIAICPVLYAKNERDSVDIGWFLYDKTLRSKLATMFYSPPYFTGYPIGVEQTFFLRCFESTVYKTSNVKNYTLIQQFPDPKERALEEQRMELQPFEWEHDFWIREYSHQ